MNNEDLVEWCSIAASQLEEHPSRRLGLRIVEDSASMGRVMAEELVDAIVEAANGGRTLRAIIPCGPRSWYAPFAEIVNTRQVDLRALEVFHMDECLDWQGRLLPRSHPFSFRGAMEVLFYAPIDPGLAVPEVNRHWLEPGTMDEVEELLAAEPADIALGGWGQDGHVAYNQARRNPYNSLSLEALRGSTVRIQENNTDTVIALGQRDLGGAFQLAPPMSVTLGMKQILAAGRIRLFSDTGSWKQTALRVALFSPEDVLYPITLLQSHPDAVLTATMATADHPISRHPEWRFW